MDMELIKLIVSALPGIAAIITLIYQLVKYVRQSIKEKRWPELIRKLSILPLRKRVNNTYD